MGTQHYRPAYLQALIFKFMFLNLPHCDDLKMVNTAEPQYHFIYVVSRDIGFPDKKNSSKSDEGALRNMSPKNTNFRVLIDFSTSYTLAPSSFHINFKWNSIGGGGTALKSLKRKCHFNTK